MKWRLADDDCDDEYSRLSHGWVRQKLDDDSSETAKHRAPHPGHVSARHLVGLVGGEAAEEAGDELDQGDDGQERRAHTDTVLKWRRNVNFQSNP